MQNNSLAEVVIITGASSGLGFVLSKILSSSKYILALGARRTNILKNLAQDLTPVAHDVFIQKLDVCNELSIKRFINKIAKKYGKIDILINNAGYTNPLGILEINTQEWFKTINTNLTGPFLMTRECINFMKNRNAKIINVASTAGLTPRPGWSAYAASKGGLINFSITMSEELRSYNIKVYCIAPGRMATPLRKILAPDEDSEKIMKPESVAKFIKYLIENDDDILDQNTIILRKSYTL